MSTKRYFVIVVLAILSGIVGGFLSSRLGSRSVVRAEKFIVVDGSGKERAWFGVDKVEKIYLPPRLSLLGKDGYERASICICPTDTATLQLYSTGLTASAILQVTADGRQELMFSGTNGGMTLYPPNTHYEEQ